MSQTSIPIPIPIPTETPPRCLPACRLLPRRPLSPPIVMTPSQSIGLSNRHIAMHKDGRTLVDDSNVSEGNLKTIIDPLLAYARDLITPHGGCIQYFKFVEFHELEEFMRDPSFTLGRTDAEKENLDINPLLKTSSSRGIRPDAGIIMWNVKGKQYPLYIGEDKVQGTNDKLHAAGKPRQATGNAIERYFKNVRAEEMMCAHVPYFPSVVFASGCDFHHSETIAARLEIGNYCVPNHSVYITNNETETDVTSQNKVAEDMRNLVANIRIQKRTMGKYIPFASVATVCVKAHKWNEMPHKSSLWMPHEYLAVSKRIVELATKEVALLLE